MSATMASKNHKPSPLGIVLKRLRMSAGMSQRKLEAESKVHHVTIAMLETGARQEADPATVRKLAAALGVRAGDLTDAEPLVASSAAVEDYLSSPFASIDQPSDVEVAWLRSLPPIFWREVEPSARAVHHILEARRSGKSAS